MKKYIVTILILLSFSGIKSTQIQNGKDRRLKTGLNEMLEKDISKLRRKGCSDFIIYNNDCFFYNCKYMKPVSEYMSTYYFLFYKKGIRSFLNLYDFTDWNKYRVSKLEGFDTQSLWQFHDTCNVLQHKCNDAVQCDGYDSFLYFYKDKDTIAKEYFFDGSLFMHCADNNYVLFMNGVAEAIKQFYFVSNRYDLKKVLGKKHYKIICDIHRCS